MKPTRNTRAILALIVPLAMLASGVSGQTYVATHSCAGYTSRGTAAIEFEFSTSRVDQLFGFMWVTTLPSGWSVTSVVGGGVTWDATLEEGTYWISPSLITPTANPLRVTINASVPGGESGEKSVTADAYYMYSDMGDFAFIRATPDPLVIGKARRTLEVISAHGTATPPAGIHTYVDGDTLNVGVTGSDYLGTTQYVCTGWAMTGNAPTRGATNSFSMTVTNSATLTWRWAAVTNPVPVITALSPGTAQMGDPGLTLTIRGTGFAPAARARWNGAERTTVFISATELRAQIPAADIVHAGFVAITVVNPEPGGGISAAFGFEVQPAGTSVWLF